MRTLISLLAVIAVVLAVYLIAVNLWPGGHGSLVVISDPPGAQVWIDLEPTNVVTDGKVPDVPEGEHSVTVKLDTLMADPFALVVNVRRGKPDTVRFVLRPPPVASSRVAGAAGGPPVSSTPDMAPIPTAADVRGSPLEAHTTGVSRRRDRADSTNRAGAAPALPPAGSSEISAPAKSPDTGVISISSSQPGATIFLNDRELAERTPANIPVPFGTYTIHAELEGYQVTPDQESVRISRAAASQSVHFTLERSRPDARVIFVETTPVEGRIYVNGDFAGDGKISVTRDLGAYVVTFGDVEGWRAPSPVRITLTTTHRTDSVTAKYVRLFHAFAQAAGADSVALENMKGWSSGIIFESGRPQSSVSLGPKLVSVPDAKDTFAWELGMGDPNRNPTGGDYVAVTFRLPDDVPPDTPLNLRLYLYKSSRRYPFSLSGRSEVVVEVNGKRFLDGLNPQFTASAAGEGRYEEWSLHDALKSGDNQILVYTGRANTVFNYLHEIEIQ